MAEISLSVYKGLATRFNVSAVDATKQILKAVKDELPRTDA